MQRLPHTQPARAPAKQRSPRCFGAFKLAPLEAGRSFETRYPYREPRPALKTWTRAVPGFSERGDAKEEWLRCSFMLISMIRVRVGALGRAHPLARQRLSKMMRSTLEAVFSRENLALVNAVPTARVSQPTERQGYERRVRTLTHGFRSAKTSRERHVS